MMGLRWEAIFSATAGEWTPTTAKVRYRAIQPVRESGTSSCRVSARLVTFRDVKRASRWAVAGAFLVVTCAIHYAEESFCLMFSL